MNKIRFYREQKGLQLEDVAAVTQLSVGFLSHLEHGDRNPSVKTMKAIAQTLEQTVQEVFFPDEVSGRCVPD